MQIIYSAEVENSSFLHTGIDFIVKWSVHFNIILDNERKDDDYYIHEKK